MKARRVTRAVRRRVAEAAGYRCGYCLTSQEIVGPLLEIDHLLPESLGGSSEEANLWLACLIVMAQRRHGSTRSIPRPAKRFPYSTPEPKGGLIDHFIWADEGSLIEGVTPVGRATVEALKMNHPDIVAARRMWIEVGWHPPAL